MGGRGELLAELFLAEEAELVLRAAAAVEPGSSGRVRSPEGLNRRTGKPGRGGLYCAAIFGPIDDLACLCGRLRGAASAGQTCDRCGVLCGERRLRGERWGHIVAPIGLVHPRLVSAIAAALGCSSKQLLAVLRFEAALQDDGMVVPARAYERMGEGGAQRIAERLGPRAQTLLLTRVPVTPADWRGTRRDPQDLAYAQLITRCIRMARLIELNAPEIILINEAFMTQQAFERVYEAVRGELRARGPSPMAPTGPDAAALLAAVYDDPGDDAARREYGEYLRTSGDPRGEFIGLQLARKGSRPSPREADLLRRNYDVWAAPFAALSPEVGFRRGFPASCKVAVNASEPRIGDPAWATIERLDSDLLALIVDPSLRGLTELALGWKTLIGLAAGDSALPRVDTLELRLGRCPPAPAGALTQCSVFPGLRRLTLVHASARGEQAWGWLDGTALARQLERLTLVVTFERTSSFALAWCVKFMQVHRQLEGLDIEFGRRSLAIELRREGEWLGVRVRVPRRVLEAIALGDAAMAGSIARLLTAIDPYGISSLRVDSPCKWFGDELAGLALALRGHFGAVVTTPMIV